MGAEADTLCGAGYGERSSGPDQQRNGYRHRDFDTRAGTLDVAIPKLRSGSYFPDWLLERRKRAEKTLTSVVATCYLLGVSTRRMEKLVEPLGITSLSKSQVSMMAKDLDAQGRGVPQPTIETQSPVTGLTCPSSTVNTPIAGRDGPVDEPGTAEPILNFRAGMPEAVPAPARVVDRLSSDRRRRPSRAETRLRARRTRVAAWE